MATSEYEAWRAELCALLSFAVQQYGVTDEQMRNLFERDFEPNEAAYQILEEVGA